MAAGAAAGAALRRCGGACTRCRAPLRRRRTRRRARPPSRPPAGGAPSWRAPPSRTATACTCRSRRVRARGGAQGCAAAHVLGACCARSGARAPSAARPAPRARAPRPAPAQTSFDDKEPNKLFVVDADICKPRVASTEARPAPARHARHAPCCSARAAMRRRGMWRRRGRRRGRPPTRRPRARAGDRDVDRLQQVPFHPRVEDDRAPRHRGRVGGGQQDPRAAAAPRGARAAPPRACRSLARAAAPRLCALPRRACAHAHSSVRRRPFARAPAPRALTPCTRPPRC